MRVGRVVAFVFLAIGLAGCGNRGDQSSTALYFTEQEQGTDLYQTRMVVTDRYLRIDSGLDDDDFILFDRKSPMIYSVNATDRTVLVIEPLKIGLPQPKVFRHEISKDPETYPDVGGKTVSHYQFSTNKDLCYDVFVAQGLMPDATAALREYALTLAGEQADALRLMPKEMQTACDLANNVFVPARHLEFGFPIRQLDMNGRMRQLTNFDEHYDADPKLFVLPEDYRRYHTRDLRGQAGA